MNRGFRIYDKQAHKMINDPTIDECILLASNGNLIDTHNYGLYLMERYARMDSTGLIDCANQEIYADDFCEVWTDNIKGRKLVQIVYDDALASFVMVGLESWNCTILRGYHFEIVGNHWENPELKERLIEQIRTIETQRICKRGIKNA